MEFFAVVPCRIEAAELQQRLTIGNLPRLCASIEKVLRDDPHHGEIYCLWGQFEVNRELIRGGVRFSLPGCPNALAWTVTVELPPDPAQIVFHCSINRQTHEADFIESLQAFVEDWRLGIAREFGRAATT